MIKLLLFYLSILIAVITGCSQINHENLNIARFMNAPNYGCYVPDSFFDKDFFERQIYIVQFENENSGKYKIIDSANTILSLREYNDGIITYFQIQDSCAVFIMGKMESTYSSDTMAIFCENIGLNCDFSLYKYDYYPKESLLAFAEYEELRNGKLKALTILTRINRLNGVDTLITMHSTFPSGFSNDGKELYLNVSLDNNYNKAYRSTTVGVLEISTLLFYTLPIDTVGQNNYHAQRIDVSSPVFYKKFIKSRNSLNIWKYDLINGEQQVTFFEDSTSISNFRLFTDSIWCNFRKQGAKKRDTIIYLTDR